MAKCVFHDLHSTSTDYCHRVVLAEPKCVPSSETCLKIRSWLLCGSTTLSSIANERTCYSDWQNHRAFDCASRYPRRSDDRQHPGRSEVLQLDRPDSRTLWARSICCAYFATVSETTSAVTKHRRRFSPSISFTFANRCRASRGRLRRCEVPAVSTTRRKNYWPKGPWATAYRGAPIRRY